MLGGSAIRFGRYRPMAARLAILITRRLAYPYRPIHGIGGTHGRHQITPAEQLGKRQRQPPRKPFTNAARTASAPRR